MTSFSILELTVAIAVLLAAAGGVFPLMLPSNGVLASQSEAGDMQQRLRIAADALARGLVSAGAGPFGAADGSPFAATVAAIRPYRVGAVRPDPPGTFRRDTISVLSLPRTAIGSATPQSSTYWQQSDDAARTYQLMLYDGAGGADVPVVDHVVSVEFEYWGDPPAGGSPALVKLTPDILTDGPWMPDDAAADRWDADLLRIRRIAVTIRVEAAIASLRGPASALFAHAGTATSAHAWAPDIEAHFDVTPRNLNLAR